MSDNQLKKTPEQRDNFPAANSNASDCEIGCETTDRLRASPVDECPSRYLNCDF